MLITGSIGSDSTEGGAEIILTDQTVTVSGTGFTAGADVWFDIRYHYDPPVYGSIHELTVAGKNNADENGTASTGPLPRTILPEPAKTVTARVSDAPIHG